MTPISGNKSLCRLLTIELNAAKALRIAVMMVMALCLCAFEAHAHRINVTDQVQRINGSNGVVVRLPWVRRQSTDYTCGPNSLAKVLAAYGYNSSYESLVRLAQRQHAILPERILGQSTSGFRTGYKPNSLRDMLSSATGHRAYAGSLGSDLNMIFNLLDSGYLPVVLLRVDSFRPARGLAGTWPLLHWVVVTGYDRTENKIFYADTGGVPDPDYPRFSETYSYSISEFMNKWMWRVGSGLANTTLQNMQVRGGTTVHLDRRLPGLSLEERLPQNRATVNGIPLSASELHGILIGNAPVVGRPYCVPATRDSTYGFRKNVAFVDGNTFGVRCYRNFGRSRLEWHYLDLRNCPYRPGSMPMIQFMGDRLVCM